MTPSPHPKGTGGAFVSEIPGDTLLGPMGSIGQLQKHEAATNLGKR